MCFGVEAAVGITAVPAQNDVSYGQSSLRQFDLLWSVFVARWQANESSDADENTLDLHPNSMMPSFVPTGVVQSRYGHHDTG